MMRVFFIEALLFLLPAILYGTYLYLVRRKPGAEADEARKTPYMALVLSGLAFMALGMLAMAYISGDDPSGNYTPARMEDGKIVPGEYR